MLDSPDSGDHRNWLEEFFERYTQGKSLDLTEDQVRRQMAEAHGVGFSELSRILHGLAASEQQRGQRGLSKFLARWKQDFEELDGPEPLPSSGMSASTWSLVSQETPPKLVSPPGLHGHSAHEGSTLSAAQVVERPGAGVKIGAPTIYGKEDRKAGAGAPASDPMSVLAKAIQSQTAEIASLVKAQVDHGAHPQGTIKGLTRLSEEMVYLIRACDEYQVTVCPGEVGVALANSLLAAQVGAATKLRAMGFRQKMTNRLAIGLAGPFWGSQEKFCLGASDFVYYTDAELDTFTVERTQKTTQEQRPAQPTRIEDWESRVRRQNEVWSLVYGSEWKEVRQHAADTLAHWHQESPHKWPLNIVVDTWEELHWRFLEEIKELLRLLKKEAGRESMSLQEIRFYALLPGPDGRAWLKLPNTFDIQNPEGWFKQELEPRIERRQERTLWRMTWEGGKRDRVHQPAGGSQEQWHGDRVSGGAEKSKGLLGPKLSTEEVNKARDRAPVDENGVLLCWSNLTHQGCTVANCQRSHKTLKGPFEQLDPCVRMQLIRRGGLRRMKQETKENSLSRRSKIRGARLQQTRPTRSRSQRRRLEQLRKPQNNQRMGKPEETRSPAGPR